MILNTGLDAACTNTSATVGIGVNQTPRFCAFVEYAAFGTGSTAPDPADTALDAQVGSRTNANGGFVASTDSGIDPNTDTVWAESTFTRVFSIGSNVNAAEWGLSPAAAGNLSVRELFRADPNDNQSSPVTLTLETGDQLQLIVTLRVEATWGYDSKSFVITGTAGNDTNGTHTGQASVVAVGSALTALGCVWPGGAGTSDNDAYLRAYHTSQSGRAIDANLTGAPTEVTPVLADYTPGNHYRDRVATFTTAQANGDHYAWHQGNGNGSGYRFILTNPTLLTKQNTHRLALTLRTTIARL